MHVRIVLFYMSYFYLQQVETTQSERIGPTGSCIGMDDRNNENNLFFADGNPGWFR